jgi:hypothetical protein
MATAEEQKILDEAVKAKETYEQQTAILARQTEAYKFLSRAPSYPNNDANATIMRSILASLGLPWTAESMERVWGDQKFRDRFTAAAPVLQAPVTSPELETPSEPVDPNQGITVDLIRSWTKEEHKAQYADRTKRRIIDRVLAEFAAAHPKVDAASFNRGSY